MGEPLLDLEELFGIEEEEREPKKTDQKKPIKEKKESRSKGNQSTKKTESADTVHSEGTEGKSESVSGSTEQRGDTGTNKRSTKRNTSKEPVTDEKGWNVNVIGTPKGHPNPYFKGLVGFDGFEETQILVPFKEVKSISRQVYVDNVTIENPEVFEIQYRVIGSFPHVVARVTEEVFNEAIKSKHLKHATVRYSWISDHLKKKRNYQISHDGKPTEEEIKAIDKHENEIEWALMPSWRKREMEKADEKLKDMPKEEEVPLPQDEFNQGEETENKQDE